MGKHTEMALEEYRSKRDFNKTPEPAPSRIRARKSKLSYLVQKHDATRLHYDFRLELDGVLLSWAVTKGPSINPGDKRLAVRTEDHPLSYGSFEGTIPKGQYGGGTVMLWDTGSWDPVGDPHAGLKKGHLSFILHGNRLKGKWDLVRMHGDGKRENWLLIKHDDEYAARGESEEFLKGTSYSATTGRTMDEIAGGATTKPSKKSKSGSADGLEKLMRRYPGVQLATLADAVPAGEDWLHEIKFDGYRLLGFVVDGECRLRTRNGKDWTERFPSLSHALQELKAKSAVLDMEAVILNAQGKSSFQALQAALGERGNPEEIVASVFDILYLDGNDLAELPLIERKERLEALLKRSRLEALRYSGHVAGQGAACSCQSLQDRIGGHCLKGRRCALCGRASEKLVENQVRASGRSLSFLVSATHAKASGRWARSIWDIARTATSSMRARSALALR